MKKRLKMLLPVFLLALVFGVILAVNAGARRGAIPSIPLTINPISITFKTPKNHYERKS